MIHFCRRSQVLGDGLWYISTCEYPLVTNTTMEAHIFLSWPFPIAILDYQRVVGMDIAMYQSMSILLVVIYVYRVTPSPLKNASVQAKRKAASHRPHPARSGHGGFNQQWQWITGEVFRKLRGVHPVYILYGSSLCIHYDY